MKILDKIDNWLKETEEEISDEILIPLSFGILASFFTASAFLCMKMAHNRFARGESSMTQVFFDKFWILGFITMLMGCLLNILSVGTGSQMIMGGTSSSTIVLTCILSVCFLNERLLSIDIIGIIITVVGSTLFISQSKISLKQYTP